MTHPSSNGRGGRTSRRPRLVLALAAAAAAAVGLVSCSASTSLVGTLPVVGTFRLLSVNSSSLPYLSGTSYVVRGSLSIQGNSRYQLSETDSSAAGLATLTSAGLWDVTSNEVTFHDDGGTVYVGALGQNSDTLRVQIQSHLSLYVRQ